jgi:hypothetical protein
MRRQPEQPWRLHASDPFTLAADGRQGALPESSAHLTSEQKPDTAKDALVEDLNDLYENSTEALFKGRVQFENFYQATEQPHGSIAFSDLAHIASAFRHAPVLF